MNHDTNIYTYNIICMELLELDNYRMGILRCKHIYQKNIHFTNRLDKFCHMELEMLWPFKNSLLFYVQD